MQNLESTQIETLLRASDSPIAVCISFLLSWIAVSDGPPTRQERDALFSFSASGLRSRDLDLLLDLAGRGDAGALLLACNTIKRSLAPKAREHLMEMLVAMALADGEMSLPARYIIEFLADHFELGLSLSMIHRNLTGRPIPPSRDPSSRREIPLPRDRTKPAQQSDGLDKWGRLTVSAVDGDIQDRHQALSILGLPEASGMEEVKIVFRRLAREHHPDHHMADHHLTDHYQPVSPGPTGSDATVGTPDQDGSFEATLRFIRIKKAYEYLRHASRPV